MLPTHFFFYLALSCLLIHEMDAVRCKEWRIFPILSSLEEKTGFQVFMLAHIPLFGLLLWALIGSENPENWIQGLNYFCIFHLFAHILFLRHPKNEFKDWMSWLWIAGAGIFAVLDFIFFS